MSGRPRRRSVLGWVAGSLVAALALGGIATALSRPPAPAYTTATVTTGTITQSWTATGSLTRVNQVTAAFAAPGEVIGLAVKVGDQVQQGQTLATVDDAQARLAVLQAEAAVAQARAQLDASLNAGSSASGASAAAAAAAAQAQALVQLQAQVIALTAQLKAASQAATTSAGAAKAAQEQRQQTVAALAAALASPACTAVFAPPTPAKPAASAVPSVPAPILPSGSASASSPAPNPSAEASAPADASPSAAQTAACLAALRALTSTPAVPPGSTGAQPPTTGASSAAASGTGAAASGMTTTRSAATGAGASGTSASTDNSARVAADRASLLQAQQQLAQAQTALERTVLTAPIAGRIGAMTLAEGLSSAGQSATIIGDGGAQLALQAPLSVRPLLSVNQKVTVSPPGSELTLDGVITQINELPTSATASTPSYGVTVVVSDPEQHLYAGSLATARVLVGTVADAAYLPSSAVTPTGETTGTVQLLGADGRSMTPTAVTLGARGQGRVQILTGVTVGQVVVIADHSVAVPANSNQFRPGQTSSATPVSRSSASPEPAPTPSR